MVGNSNRDSEFSSEKFTDALHTESSRVGGQGHSKCRLLPNNQQYATVNLETRSYRHKSSVQLRASDLLSHMKIPYYTA